MPRRTRQAITLLVLGAALLGGCGDDSSEESEQKRDPQPPREQVDAEYQQQLREIDDGLDSTMESLFQQGTFTRAQVQDAQAELDRAASDMDALTPPENVADAHELYTNGVRGFRPILVKLVAAQGDPEKVRAHLSDPQYSNVIADLQRAKKMYEDAGYVL